jgi:hypothetical protein
MIQAKLLKPNALKLVGFPGEPLDQNHRDYSCESCNFSPFLQDAE